MKMCKRCNFERKFEAFYSYKDKRNRDGLRSHCIACIRKQQKDKRQHNIKEFKCDLCEYETNNSNSFASHQKHHAAQTVLASMEKLEQIEGFSKYYIDRDKQKVYVVNNGKNVAELKLRDMSFARVHGGLKCYQMRHDGTAGVRNIPWQTLFHFKL